MNAKKASQAQAGMESKRASGSVIAAGRLCEDATVAGGNVIIRQRGTKFYAGEGVGMGKDHTLFALREGRVSFKTGYKRRTFVSVITGANPAMKIAAE